MAWSRPHPRFTAPPALSPLPSFLWGLMSTLHPLLPPHRIPVEQRPHSRGPDPSFQHWMPLGSPGTVAPGAELCSFSCLGRHPGPALVHLTAGGSPAQSCVRGVCTHILHLECSCWLPSPLLQGSSPWHPLPSGQHLTQHLGSPPTFPPPTRALTRSVRETRNGSLTLSTDIQASLSAPGHRSPQWRLQGPSSPALPPPASPQPLLSQQQG